MLRKTIKRVNFLLDNDEKNKFALIIIISSFVSIFEIASLMLILPFIGIAINNDIIFNYEVLKFSYDILRVSEPEYFVFYLGATLVFLYITRVFVNVLHQHSITSFSHNVVAKFRSKLLLNDLQMKYTDFSILNTSQLSNNIMIESNNIYHIIYPILTIISELIVFMIFFLILMFNNPNVTTIMILFLSITSYSIIHYFKDIFSKKGKQRNVLSEIISKVINESLGNIKYIKISNQVDNISNYFGEINRELSKINSNYMVLTTLPKNILETIGLITIISLVLFFSLKEDKDILSTFGLYVIAFYRLLPSINKIIMSFNSIRFYERSIDRIKENLSLVKESYVLHDEVLFEKTIKLNNVAFKYGDNLVLKDLDFCIQKNDHIAIVGESGSGKTTLLNIITSLIMDIEGKVLIDSVELDSNNVYSWRQKIGYIPQDVYLFDGTVAENIAFGFDKIDRHKVERVLKTVKLYTLFEGKSGLDTRVGDNAIQLSGGQKQRVAIARALYREPEILVLDEATSALDEKTEREIMDDVYDICREKTLIIIAHRLSTINRCNRTVGLFQGVLNEKYV